MGNVIVVEPDESMFKLYGSILEDIGFGGMSLRRFMSAEDAILGIKETIERNGHSSVVLTSRDPLGSVTGTDFVKLLKDTYGSEFPVMMVASSCYNGRGLSLEESVTKQGAYFAEKPFVIEPVSDFFKKHLTNR